MQGVGRFGEQAAAKLQSTKYRNIDLWKSLAASYKLLRSLSHFNNSARAFNAVYR
jgi:hypothetical protein